MQIIEKGMLYLLSIGITGYVVVAYGFMPLGSLVHPDMMTSFNLHPAGIYAHAFASALALLLGPFQFSVRLRQKHLNIHRWMGRLYLGIGVLLGGIAGFYISFYAYGGIVAQLGFASLAITWMYTGLRAYLAIRSGNITNHRKWMLRNYALTFAAVMLRIYLPVAMVAGFEFTQAYIVIAWLCWLPNLVYAELRSRYSAPNLATEIS